MIKKTLNRISWEENTLLDSEKKKQKEMMNSFDLKKDQKEKITLLNM